MKEGRKDRALLVLRFRKKKLKESDAVSAQLLRVLEMVSTINWQTEQASILSSLAKGKDMLKKMHEEYSVDDVMDLMEEIQEQNENESRIGEILGRGVSLDTVDDEECMGELEEMEREMGIGREDEKEEEVKGEEIDMPDAPMGMLTDMPEVPKGRVGEKERERGENREAVPG
ncbi:hypothetical protein TrCOL_g4038 [Triparma columacea]|uniref:Uncharacterized protein n=1 Tax=Triparma columacea TaxID=722753 RepID=A0A9W7GGI6_9STRA|nr:hypothetical protein TrCOL_g4038 [Triparma columacea]